MPEHADVQLRRFYVEIAGIETDCALLRGLLRTARTLGKRKKLVSEIDGSVKTIKRLFRGGLHREINERTGLIISPWLFETIEQLDEVNNLAGCFADSRFDKYPLLKESKRLERIEKALRRRANKAANFYHFDPVQIVPTQGKRKTGGKGPKRKRGGKRIYDEADQKRAAKAWATGNFNTYAKLTEELRLDMKPVDVKKMVESYNKARARSKKRSPN